MYPTTIDSFTAIKSYGDTISESLTIPASVVPIVVNSTYPILDQVSVPGYVEVTTLPVAGQFRVYYKTTQIEFGPVVATSTVASTYRTWGTPIKDLPIQAMINAIVAIEQTLGLNPQGSYSSVLEYLNSIVALLGHTHKVSDLTSQVDGIVTVFALTEAPTLSDATLVLYNGVPAQIDQDFTISGTSLVWIATDIPDSGDTLVVHYIK